MTIEVTAKKVQDAINQGLEQLGATLDEVEVHVIDQGGLFKKAKVQLTVEREEAPAPAPEKAQPDKTEKQEQPQADKQERSEKTEKAAPQKQEKPAPQKQEKPVPQKQAKPDKAVRTKANKPEKAEAVARPEADKPAQQKQPRKLSEEDKLAAAHALEFLNEVIKKMGFESAQTKADESGEYISVTADEGDDSLIIGRHGETLSALAYLAETCARAEKAHINITVDCNGYRDRRAASLTAMAKRRASECAQKRRKIKLEPMERIDRRTIHNALTGDNRVTTASEGKEPHRYVVIMPKK